MGQRGDTEVTELEQKWRVRNRNDHEKRFLNGLEQDSRFPQGNIEGAADEGGKIKIILSNTESY